MSQSLIELAERRERLIAKSANLRAGFAGEVQPLKRALAVADRGVEGFRYLQQHPGIVAAAVGLFVVLRPRRAISWAMRGWSMWRLFRNVRQRITESAIR
ncbi:MAG: YqjK-like family protein [Sulfuricellaceae bacterium]|nr:YqjK-like family protein [Sulfuricellaceae bacterium]